MENQSQTKHIADWIIFRFHIFDIDNLWGDIAWCTTSNKEIFFSIAKLSQAIIGNDAIKAIFVSKK